MKCFIIVFFSIHFSFYSLFSQQDSSLMFSNQVLANPKVFSAWFDKVFEIDTIKSFNGEVGQGQLLLENGYIQYEIRDKESKILCLPKGQPEFVHIIFSNYPKNKNQWHTNYYDLLANRLKELFSVDPSLNSRKLNWKLVLQTECSNTAQASSLFHGILVGYIVDITQKIVPTADIEVPKTRINKIPNNEISIVPSPGPNPDLVVINRNQPKPDLYPEQFYPIYERPDLKKKKKRRKEPSCPTFTTRADKPRKSLRERLFR
jgi:hypothetical protein